MKNGILARWNSGKSIVYVDQGVSAFSNYLILLIPIVLQDWKTFGQIVLFQSFYVLFNGISRSALGTSQIVNTKSVYIRQLLGYSVVVSLGAGVIAIPLLSTIKLNPLLLLFVFIFPLLQDLLRFACFNNDLPRKVLESDLIWLLCSVFFYFIFIDEIESKSTVFIMGWSVGAIPALLWFLSSRKMRRIISSKSRKNQVARLEIFNLGISSFLAEVNTIAINWIVVFFGSSILLGNFRFYQVCLLPIAYLINVNRLLLTPLFRDGENEEAKRNLKIQFPLKLLFYFIGIIVVVLFRGFFYQNFLAFLLVIGAVECSYQRNILYMRYIAIKNPIRVLQSLSLYLVISVILFLWAARAESTLLLTAILALIEVINLFLARFIGRNRA